MTAKTGHHHHRKDGRTVLHFEHKDEPLLPRRHFYRRVLRNGMIAGALVAGSLAIGVVGYHWLGQLGWIDSLLNASMILTGMGPVDRMEGAAAKIFASAYALFSGVAFLTSMGVLLAPAFHRFIHRFHLDPDDASGE
jgi:hypothetical protein